MKSTELSKDVEKELIALKDALLCPPSVVSTSMFIPAAKRLIHETEVILKPIGDAVPGSIEAYYACLPAGLDPKVVDMVHDHDALYLTAGVLAAVTSECDPGNYTSIGKQMQVAVDSGGGRKFVYGEALLAVPGLGDHSDTVLLEAVDLLEKQCEDEK